MNGSIDVESEFGRGANFFFTVSLKRPPESRTILDDLSLPELASKRVLVINENGSLSHAVQPYLESAGLTTTAVNEAQRAVFQLKSALLQAVPFHLLIVDFDRKYAETNKPFFEAIAESARDSRTPIIYLINFDEKEKVLKSVKSTYASSFLTKPIRQLAFYQLVAELLSRSAYSSENWEEEPLTGLLIDSAALTGAISHEADNSKRPDGKAETEPERVNSAQLQTSPPPDAQPQMPGQAAAHGQSLDVSQKTTGPIRMSAAGSSLITAKADPDWASKNRKHKILLAEDNSIMQKVALQQLTKLGFTVTAVSNGREVLEELKNSEYSMILMDCQMPIIDGFETTKIIRSAEKKSGKHIPVVALTASAMEDDEEICYAAGMDDYLCKPVDRQKLHSIMNKWCPGLSETEVNEDSSTASVNSGIVTGRGTETGSATTGARTGSGTNYVVETALAAHEQKLTVTAPETTAHTAGSALFEETGKFSDAELAAVSTFDSQQLVALYGKDAIPELLVSFSAEGATILINAKKALENRDLQQLKAEAHTFKGMAAVLTAHQLARISLNLEKAAKTAAFDEAERCIKQLEEAFKAAKESVQGFLDKDLT
jgi:CheY-like chemotaxis protein